MLQRRLALLVAGVLIVAGCRPQLGPSPTPTESSVAGALVPKQAMSVTVHLPGAAGPIFAGVSAVGAAQSLTAANITVNAIPLGSESDAFTPAKRDDVVDLYVVDTATALEANARGGDLVMIASLQRTPTWRLMTLKSGKIKTPSQLAGKSIYIDGLHGDELALSAALTAAGVSVSGVTYVFPDDSSTSFDPTQLQDGTVAAAFVRTFDGYIRLAQFADPKSGTSVGEAYYREIPVAPLGTGLGIWASAAWIKADDAKIAAAATLVAMTQSFAKCRDDVPTCASVMVDSSLSDLDADTLAWGINAINASLWPNAMGLFELDKNALQSEVDAAAAAGLAGSASADALLNVDILKLAKDFWPAGVDRNGATWAPLTLAIPLY